MDRAFYRLDNIKQRDVFRSPGENIAATRPALAVDEVRVLELQKNLFKKPVGDILAVSDVLAADRRALSVEGNVEHGADGVHALAGKLDHWDRLGRGRGEERQGKAVKPDQPCRE